MILPAFIFILTFLYQVFSCRLNIVFCKLQLQGIFIFKTRQGQNGMSAFAALSSIIGGNLGTGNISGVQWFYGNRPGAIFWMWFMAIIGAIFKYCICFLSVKHREYNTAKNEYTGGARIILNQPKMKFISYGLAVMIIVAAFLIGNIVQINSIVLPAITFGMNQFFVQSAL